MNLSDIPFFYCKRDVSVAGVKCLISRTGYTGEDGFEIYTTHAGIEKIWETLLAEGAPMGLKPAGLGARDTLRFEATLPLYGNEIDQSISPLEAGYGFCVKLDKDQFIGKSALEAQKNEGIPRKIVGFEMEKGIPRHGYPVMSQGETIGVVTTGYFSPTLKKNIGLALVDSKFGEMGSTIEIAVRKKVFEAKVISKKFYQKNHKK